MNNKRNKKRKSLALLLGRALTISLLFLYLLGSQSKEIHKILRHDHHESIVHTSQQEEDPCHRNIFHHEKNACKHQAHITNSEKCSLCELAAYTGHTLPANDSSTTILQPSASNSSDIDFLITDLSIHLCSRAPPVF